jgi:hypothetical protein
MYEPQIDTRRAENASTSAPVLLGTSLQPAPPARTQQAASSKKAAVQQAAQAGAPSKKSTLGLGRGPG